MHADINHGKNYIEFDGSTFFYKNSGGYEKSIKKELMPQITYERPGVFSAGEMQILINGKVVDVIPYYNNEVLNINKVVGALSEAEVAFANKGIDLEDPHAYKEIEGMKINVHAFFNDGALKIAHSLISNREVLHIALQGMFKEYLIVTDKTLYILKKGYMTGHFIGQGAFTIPLSDISNTSVDFHLMSGYFLVAASGMQNTRKDFWSTDKDMDPAKAPNTISLNAAVKSNFLQATQIINTKLIPESRKQSVTVLTENHRIDIADEIRKFKSLLDDGIITQEEFDAKKKQLLGL